MKKFNSILISMTVIAIFCLTATSCTRKVGCYFSKTHEELFDQSMISANTAMRSFQQADTKASQATNHASVDTCQKESVSTN